MLRRAVWHDYSGRSMYMVTLVTEGRRPLLGTLAGHSDGAAGTDDEPRCVLSPLGDAVRREWWDTSRHHPEIAVVALQMMPDPICTASFL